MKNKGFVSGLIIGILALGLVLSCDTDNNDNGDKTPTLENITVNYEQGGTVYPSTPLDDLKTDLTVTANYSDGSNSTVTGYTLNGTLTACASEITVSFQGKTAKFNVIVTATGATLSYITAEYNQSGIVYPSTPLDDLKDDLIVTAHFSDNSEQEAHGYILSGELQIGESELTVTYEGNITTFNVNVTDPTVTLLNITAVYTQGGKTIFTSTPLDDLKEDLIVTAHLSDENENYNPTGYELSGTLAVGTSIITASYNGKTTTFEVNVSIEYVTITWHLNGGSWSEGFTPVTQVEKGGTLAFKYKQDTFIEPVKNNCDFTWNWYTDRELTQLFWGEATEWPSEVIINNNLTLYAGWQQITPQLYWGNFIPTSSTTLANMPQQTFSIDDLIEHIDNAREFRVLTGPSTGTLWGTEFKHSETAVKTDKTINFISSLGYMCFISPEEFGNVVIREPDQTDITTTWEIAKKVIDGINYYVCVIKTVQTVNSSGISLIFDLP